MKKLTALTLASLAILVLAAVPVLAQVDTDGDFWFDPVDNCPLTKNSNQRDSDADGVGNVCDNCPFHPNPSQVNVCDPPPPPMGAISGTDREAFQACIVSAFANPNDFFDVKGATAVFDTGAEVIVLGGEIAEAIDPNEDFFDPGDSQTVSKIALDSRNMGLQTGNSVKGWPTLAPEAEVQDVWVRVTGLKDEDSDLPILVGAPFVNQVYAYIDHTQTTTEPIPGNPPQDETCPAVSFWFDAAGTPVPPQDSPLDPPPDPLFCADLQRFGSTLPGSSTQPTKGQRYHIRGMRFDNGSNVVESPASGAISSPSRFLYDTGNKTTQISESMAVPLGINTSAACTGPDCVLHEIDDVNRKCYKIDSVEIDADDSSYQYVLNDPWVCVVPDGSGALGSSSDANIGMNYFEPTQTLFDGINDKLCLFAGVATSTTAPTLINDLLGLSALGTDYDPTPASDAPAGVFTISATFDNISSLELEGLFFEVVTLTGGNLVLNADGGPGGEGASVSVPPGDLGTNGILDPGESFTIDFEIGLANRRPFSFFVDAYGIITP